MLSDLAVFVAVVDAGSFTTASGKLDLSKSMVSKCMNRLESSLGARLLHRTTRRLRLTEAGAALYETSAGALFQTTLRKPEDYSSAAALSAGGIR